MSSMEQIVSLDRIIRIMEILGGTDVPVPRTYWLESDGRVLGAPFYVMERIDGRIPTDTPPYHVGGWMTEISPEERTSMWWSGLEALARGIGFEIRRLGKPMDPVKYLPPI